MARGGEPAQYPPVVQKIVASGEARIENVRQIVNLHPRAATARFLAPPLPTHFVARPEILDAVKADLLTPRPAGAGDLPVGALQGLPGSGKSTLACALAHDPEVRERFADGVLWADLGREPELPAILGLWLRELQDYDPVTADLGSVSQRLGGLLADKAVLLIVDNVWDEADARPFLVGGPRCHALVTTRRVDVADELGARLYEVGVLSRSQALKLIAARLERPLEGEEEASSVALADLVGGLPLALEQVAVRISRGSSWSQLAEALDAEVARLEALEGPRRRKRETRLEACFNLSLNALRDSPDERGAWEGFAWLGALPEEAAVAAPMAATLWGVEEVGEAAERLELLWNDGLLTGAAELRVEDRTWPAYRVHNLLHDMAARLLTADGGEGLGVTLAEANRRLLARYRQRCQPADGARAWHTLPDDGYIHAHLTWHFKAAGEAEEIHALLAEDRSDGRNGWFEACDRLGQTHRFFADLAAAWRLAEEASAADLAAGRSAPGLGREARYALMSASVASLAGNTPAGLIGRLAKAGLWTAEQALAYVRQIGDRGKRLAALVEVAPALPPPLHEAAVVEMASGGDAQTELWSVMALGSILPEPLLRQLHAWARELEDPTLRLGASTTLAVYFPPAERGALLRQALVEAEGIGDLYERVDFVKDLCPYLPADDRGAPAAAAIRSLLDAEGSAGWTAGFQAAARNLVLSPQGLQAAQQYLAIRQSLYGGLIQGGLIPMSASEDVLRMSGEQFAEWLFSAAAADDIQFHEDQRKSAWLRLLAGAAPQVMMFYLQAMSEDELRRWVLGEAVDREELAALRREALLLQGLDWFGPHLEPAAAGELLDQAVAVGQPSIRFSALARLLPRLPEALRETALAAAAEAVGGAGPAEVVAGLAPYLGNADRESLLQGVAAVEEERDRVAALVAFAPHLGASLLEPALELGRALATAESRLQVLTALAPHLPEPQRSAVLAEAARAARDLGTPKERVQALVELAPLAGSAVVEEALARAAEIPPGEGRIEALEALMPHLPDGLLPQALALARAIEDGLGSSEGLGELAGALLEAGLAAEARSAARQIGDAFLRAIVLSGLAGRLPADLEAGVLDEALAAAREADPAMYRVRGGGPLECRAMALARVAQQLDGSRRVEVTLEALAGEQRQAAEETWAHAVPEVSAYAAGCGRPETALAAVEALANEGRRAQGLAELCPLLPEALLQRAIAAAAMLEDEENRARVLGNLGPEAPADLLASALELAEAIAGARGRSFALAGVGRCLPEPQKTAVLRRCLKAAEAIEDPGDWTQALAFALPHLGNADRRSALARGLERAGEIANESRRSEALAALAAHFEGDLLDRCRELALAIGDETWRENVLNALVSRWRDLGELDRAQETAAGMAGGWRVEALRGLAPHLEAAELRQAVAAIEELPGGEYGRQDQIWWTGGSRETRPVAHDPRVVLLAALAPRLAAEQRRDCLPTWRAALRRLAAGKRDHLQRHLGMLSPFLVALAGSGGLAEAARAVADVRRWWP